MGQINDYRGRKIRVKSMTQVIKLSDKAADRIKEILSENKDSLGVRTVSYTHLTLPTTPYV